jgi:23S rRNA (pseudouridine1915-N3)-methyltransferase
MNIQVIIVGRRSREEALIERFEKLIKPYAAFSVRYIKPPGGVRGNREDLLEREAESIRKKLPSRTYAIALSPEGALFKSPQFAAKIDSLAQTSKSATFIIGGAYGLAPSIKRACTEIISLSPLTFSHGICLCVLAEQIYRAYTILNGHPYHKE